MIKLKTLITEDGDSQELELLRKYPGYYYVCSNYGWGDGSCSEALNALDALRLFLEQNPEDFPPPSWVITQTLVDKFESALLPRYNSGRKPTHYISDAPEDFGRNPGDI